MHNITLLLPNAKNQSNSLNHHSMISNTEVKFKQVLSKNVIMKQYISGITQTCDYAVNIQGDLNMSKALIILFITWLFFCYYRLGWSAWVTRTSFIHSFHSELVFLSFLQVWHDTLCVFNRDWCRL